ncbi:hypothetical protein D3C73_1068320 [compost metagenome]
MTRCYYCFVWSFSSKESGYCEQAIKPPASLVNTFTDHISRELILECLYIFKRIVMLSKRHRTTVKPYVNNFRCTFHNAVFTMRTFHFHFIHIRFMKLKLLAHMTNSMLTQLSSAMWRKLSSAIRTYPYVKRSSPVTITANIPVNKLLQELTKSPFANMAWIPIHCIIVSNQLILNCSCLYEPALHRIVEKW